jgi:hypothetical protein
VPDHVAILADKTRLPNIVSVEVEPPPETPVQSRPRVLTFVNVIVALPAVIAIAGRIVVVFPVIVHAEELFAVFLMVAPPLSSVRPVLLLIVKIGFPVPVKFIIDEPSVSVRVPLFDVNVVHSTV